MVEDSTKNDHLGIAAEYFADAARCVNPLPAGDAPSPAAERMFYYEGLSHLAKGLEELHLRVMEELGQLRAAVDRTEK